MKTSQRFAIIVVNVIFGGVLFPCNSLLAQPGTDPFEAEKELVRQAVLVFETRLSMRDTVSLTGRLEGDERNIITVEGREVEIGPRSVKREFITTESRAQSVEATMELRRELAGIFARIPEYVRVRFDPDSIAVSGNTATVDAIFFFQGVETSRSRHLVSRPPEHVTIQLAKSAEEWLVTNLRRIIAFLSVVTSPITDFDGDGMVGFADFLQFAGHFGKTREIADFEPRYDLDSNGTVDFADFLIFVQDFGKHV